MSSQQTYYCMYCGSVINLQDASNEDQTVVCPLCNFYNNLKDLKIFKNIITRSVKEKIGIAFSSNGASFDITNTVSESSLKTLVGQGFLLQSYNSLMKLLSVIKLNYSTPYIYREPFVLEENINLSEYLEYLLIHASLINQISNITKDKNNESIFLLISSFIQLIKGYAEISGATSDYFWIETARLISFGRNYRLYNGVLYFIDEINENPDKRKLLLERLALQRFRIIKKFATEGIKIEPNQRLFQILLILAESGEFYTKFLIESYDGIINITLLNNSIAKLKEAREIIEKENIDLVAFKNLKEQITQSILNLENLRDKIFSIHNGLREYISHIETMAKDYLTCIKTIRINKFLKNISLLIISLGILALVYDIFDPLMIAITSNGIGIFLIFKLPYYIIIRDILLLILPWKAFKFIDQIIKRAEVNIQKISKEFELLKNTFNDFKINQVSPMLLWNSSAVNLFTNNIELLITKLNNILKSTSIKVSKTWNEFLSIKTASESIPVRVHE